MDAADLMITEVVSISPEMEVSEVARLLLTQRITALPVIDDNDHVIGMVSEADLMRRSECERGQHSWLSLFADKLSCVATSEVAGDSIAGITNHRCVG